MQAGKALTLLVPYQLLKSSFLLYYYYSICHCVSTFVASLILLLGADLNLMHLD